MGVSLYQVQKLLFHVNRDPQVRARFLDERAAAGDAGGSLLTYQPVPAWSTGSAVAALEPR